MVNLGIEKEGCYKTVIPRILSNSENLQIGT